MTLKDHNRGTEFLAVFGTGTAVATIAVLLRMWVRARIIRKIGADDWIVLVSLVNAKASCNSLIDRFNKFLC